MPTFMDRHDLAGTSAADLAQAHMADLSVQNEYGVKYLTYWFDYDRQAAFCLVEAPDAATANQVHAHAHGNIASEIIPVDSAVVGAFLGRVADPAPGAFEDSAFRAILFTDIVGSTSIGARYGDDAAIALVQRHDETVRTALEEHSGREVKHTGDGVMASFRGVSQAIRAAISIQQRIATDPGDPPLRIRIGISAGEPVDREGDLFGMAVNLASRVCDSADAGEILTTDAVRTLAIGKGFPMQPLGERAFKGLDDGVEVVRIDWALGS